MKLMIFLSLFFFSFLGFAFVQSNTINRYLPFQGKLYENGIPVTGQYAFTFSINDGGVAWTEFHTDVRVNQGLYSVVLGEITPLPDNLFKESGKHELQVYVNGSLLDTVITYAAIENDPTVPDYLKDGLSWDEVQDKPDSLDLDSTNERQVLSISGDTLFISDGNYIILPGNDGVIGNYFQVGQNDTINQPGGSQTDGNDRTTTNMVWQSFRPNTSGNLTSIELGFNNLHPSGQIYLRIRPGEGTNQQPIAQFVFNAGNYPPQSQPLFQTFELGNPVQVLVGNTYTFEIEKVNAGNANMEFARTALVDLYSGGRSSIDPEVDLNFLIHIDKIIGPNFIVQSNGTVEAPSGRIKDKSGYVAFPGEIRMFAGPVENIPEGWLLCDGNLISKNEYLDLFHAIGNAWGDGNGDQNKFRLPDLRGAFVRGVAHSSDKDPNTEERDSLYSSGNTGNKVGSFQTDEIKEHQHDVVKTYSALNQTVTAEIYTIAHEFNFFNIYAPNSGNHIQAGTRLNSSLPPVRIYANTFGGSETRPYNAYVNYVIKY